jgi:hypothetical protein
MNDPQFHRTTCRDEADNEAGASETPEEPRICSAESLNIPCQALLVRYCASAISQSRNALTQGRCRARCG